MQPIRNLKDLLIEELRELYRAEKQQLNALPRIQGLVMSQQLKDAIESHILDTTQHVNVLNDIFEELNVPPVGAASETMSDLINTCYNKTARSMDAPVSDAILISSLQYIEHYEISGYGSVCTYANELGLDDIAEKLHGILEEEKELDRQLTFLATNRQINEKAKIPSLVE